MGQNICTIYSGLIYQQNFLKQLESLIQIILPLINDQLFKLLTIKSEKNVNVSDSLGLGISSRAYVKHSSFQQLQNENYRSHRRGNSLNGTSFHRNRTFGRELTNLNLAIENDDLVNHHCFIC